MSKRSRVSTEFTHAHDDAHGSPSLLGPSPVISAADVSTLSLHPTPDELARMQTVLGALGIRYFAALEDAAQALQGIDAVVAQLSALPVDTSLLEALAKPDKLAKTAQKLYKRSTAFFEGENGRRLTVKAMAPLKAVVDNWRKLAQLSKLLSPQWEQFEEEPRSEEVDRAVAAAVAAAVQKKEEDFQQEREEFQRKKREEEDRFFVSTGNEHRDNAIKVLAMTLFTATAPFEAGVEMERILYLRYCCMDKDGELNDDYLQRIRLIWKHLSPKVTVLLLFSSCVSPS